jgi:hypothetical protein
MSRQSFRKLIILEWLIVAVALVVLFSTENHLPPELRDYLEVQKNREVTTLDWIGFTVSIVYGATYIIVYVGLYRFKGWAKTLLLPMHLVGLLVVPLHGASVATGWVAALSYSGSLVAGGILFLVYLSPVAQMFVNENAG